MFEKTVILTLYIAVIITEYLRGNSVDFSKARDFLTGLVFSMFKLKIDQIANVIKIKLKYCTSIQCVVINTAPKVRYISPLGKYKNDYNQSHKVN